MLWIKIALSTTSLETFNVCFEREEAIVRFTNFMMGSALGIMGKPLTLPSVLYVNTKRFHGLLRDPIARSRVFRLPNTLETPWNRQVPTSNANTGTEIQKCTWSLWIRTWQLSTFLLAFVLRLSCPRSHEWNANARRNANADARNGRSGLRQRLKVKLSFYLPKARTNYFKNSFAFAAVELWDFLLLVQKKRLFCKIQGEEQVVHTISVTHYKFSSFLVYRVCDLFLAGLVLDINIFLCKLIS